MTERRVIKLSKPIMVKGESVSELRLPTEPTLALMMGLPDDLSNAIAGEEYKPRPRDVPPLIAALAGITVEEACAIPLNDLDKFTDAISDFFDKFPETGEKSSGKSPTPTDTTPTFGE